MAVNPRVHELFEQQAREERQNRGTRFHDIADMMGSEKRATTDEIPPLNALRARARASRSRKPPLNALRESMENISPFFSLHRRRFISLARVKHLAVVFEDWRSPAMTVASMAVLAHRMAQLAGSGSTSRCSRTCWRRPTAAARIDLVDRIRISHRLDDPAAQSGFQRHGESCAAPALRRAGRAGCTWGTDRNRLRDLKQGARNWNARSSGSRPLEKRRHVHDRQFRLR